MTDTLIWCVVLLLAIAIPFGLLRLKKLRRLGAAEMRQRLGEDNLLWFDEKAIYYGLGSRGTIQPRRLGGIWAMTADVIAFKTFDYGKLSNFDITLPLKAVQGIYSANNFHGMAENVIGGLLVLEFRDESGQVDEIAWKLTDKAAAIAKITELTGITESA